MPACGQLSRQPNVSVQQAAHGVGDRLILVVAFDKHRIKRRNAALAALPRALDEPRQQCERRWRIAAIGYVLCRR